MEVYKLKHTGPDIDASLDALGDNGVELTAIKEQVAQISEDISSGIGATNLENGAGEKSLQATGIAEASGINAVAIGGLRYDYFAYKYSWEFSVQLPNSRYSTHYGYYYKNTEEEYATVSRADSTNISDQQIVEGGKYITPFGEGNTEYTTSLTSAVITEDGTIVSAPIITFTDVEGNVYTASMVESPYLGRIKTTAVGNQSFAAGGSTCAYGDWSVAFGKDTAAYQKASFAEGGGTIAGDPDGEDTYSFAHAEGEATKAIGRSSHSEGNNTQATGAQAHAENYMTIASGQHSHAEGSETTATNKAAHAEGYKTVASGTYSHAEGNRTEATNSGAHAEGNTTHATAQHAHAEGYNTTASGTNSHAEGYVTTASGESAHTEGFNTKAIGKGSHAEGYLGEATGLYSHVEGNGTKAQGDHSHAEGQNNTAKSANSHVEGLNNTINENSDNSHAEGSGNTISSKFAHAEGSSNKVSGESSHAEGYGNTVIGAQAHVEGGSNEVHGAYGHAEGNKNISKNWFSHVEGSDNQALHSNSHVGGKGNISGQNSQTVIGEYNFVDSGALFVVGNGRREQQADGSYKEYRSNAFTLSRDGVGNFAGKVTSAGKELITDEIDLNYFVGGEDRYEGCIPEHVGTDEYDGFGVRIFNNNICGISSNSGWINGGTTDTKVKDFLHSAGLNKKYIITYGPDINSNNEECRLVFGSITLAPGDEFTYTAEMAEGYITLTSIPDYIGGTNMAGAYNIQVIGKADLSEELPKAFNRLDELEIKSSTVIESRNLFNESLDNITDSYGRRDSTLTLAQFCPDLRAGDVVTFSVTFSVTEKDSTYGDDWAFTQGTFAIGGSGLPNHVWIHGNGSETVTITSDMLNSVVATSSGDVAGGPNGAIEIVSNTLTIMVNRGDKQLPYAPYKAAKTGGLKDYINDTRMELNEALALIVELTQRIQALENK